MVEVRLWKKMCANGDYRQTLQKQTKCFHLCHKSADRELDVYLEDTRLSHNEHFKYLGVVLDVALANKTSSARCLN